jgi:hypothetical protein
LAFLAFLGLAWLILPAQIAAAAREEQQKRLRAERRGTSNVLPGVAYPMYSDRLRGETGALRVAVE